MTSAEKRFTELLDAGLILAKSTKGDLTKMDPDIILKSPTAISKPSLCLSILLTSFCCRKFLEAGPASETPQPVSLTEAQIHDSLQGGKPLWIPEHKPADPGATQRVPIHKESSAVNTALWSISHSLTQEQGSLLRQLGLLVPWHQTHGLHSYERLFLLLPSSQPAAG